MQPSLPDRAGFFCSENAAWIAHTARPSKDDSYPMRRPVRKFRGLSLLAVVGALGACGGSDDAGRWVGKTYQLTIPASNWSEPPGIGRDIGDFVPSFLISVARGTGDDLAITLGTVAAGAQDPCNPTTAITASGAAYPGVRIAAPSVPLHIVHPFEDITVNTTIHDLAFENVLPTGAPARDGTVTATIDAAEVYPLFTQVPNRDKDNVCAALASFGAPCAACAHNAQPYCLTIGAVELGATETAIAVQPIAAANIPPSCSP
jgi:hypothetical protein